MFMHLIPSWSQTSGIFAFLLGLIKLRFTFLASSVTIVKFNFFAIAINQASAIFSLAHHLPENKAESL